MRTTAVIAAITVGMMSCFSAFAQSPSEKAVLELTQSGLTEPLDESRQLSVKFWLQQLMLSALYRDVVQDSSVDEWQHESKAQTRIYCRYSSPATLAIPERKILSFDEVLLPLAPGRYSAHVLVRDGSHVLRLGKYDPWVFHKLVAEAGVPGFDSLSMGVQRALF